MGFENPFGSPSSNNNQENNPIEEAKETNEVMRDVYPEQMTEQQIKASEAREKVVEELNNLGEIGNLICSVEITGRQSFGKPEKIVHFAGEVDGHQVDISWNPSHGPLYGETGPFVDRAIFKMDGKIMEYDTPEEKSGTMKREFFVKHKDLFLAAKRENVEVEEAEKELADMLEKTRDEDAGEVMTDKQRDASEARKAVEEEFKRLGETGHLINSREGGGFRWEGEIDGHKIYVYWDPSKGPIEEYWRSAFLKIDGELIDDPMTKSRYPELVLKIEKTFGPIKDISKKFFEKHSSLFRLTNKELVATKGKEGSEKELAQMERVKEEPGVESDQQ